MADWSWLEQRLVLTPPELAAAVRDLLDRSDGAREPFTWQCMVDRALDAFERVASKSQSRSGALELLAADALLTYAFEAAADDTVGGSATTALQLARAVGPSGELGRRVAEG